MCKYEKELEIAIKEAYSLKPGTIPFGLTFLGIKQDKFGTRRFYKNEETGEYFYTSDRIEKFHEKINANSRRKRTCLR